MELEIKVQPKAKRNAIEVSGAGDVTVRVTAAPDNGKANDAVISLLAKRLRLPKGGVEIVRGHRVSQEAGTRAGPDKVTAHRASRGNLKSLDGGD